MRKTPIFWTDIEQATERLQGCVITFNDQPVMVDVVAPGTKVPNAHITKCADHTTQVIPLDDPGFNKFRVMPKLGWFNHTNPKYGAVFLERGARRTRSHGLCNANTTVKSLLAAKRGEYIPELMGLNFSHMMYDKGFAVDCQEGIYPSLEQILINIEPTSSIAYSNVFAVLRDSLGLRWLYRNEERIGLFTGADTLNLFEKFSFHREEIMEDPAFTLNTIREF